MAVSVAVIFAFLRACCLLKKWFFFFFSGVTEILQNEMCAASGVCVCVKCALALPVFENIDDSTCRIATASRPTPISTPYRPLVSLVLLWRHQLLKLLSPTVGFPSRAWITLAACTPFGHRRM